MVLALAGAATACVHVESAVIEGKRWELWGEEKLRYRAMIYAQPPPGMRCPYWRDLAHDVQRDRPVELLGTFEVGAITASENLRAFVGAAEREVCAAETRHASSSH